MKSNPVQMPEIEKKTAISVQILEEIKGHRATPFPLPEKKNNAAICGCTSQKGESLLIALQVAQPGKRA